MKGEERKGEAGPEKKEQHLSQTRRLLRVSGDPAWNRGGRGQVEGCGGLLPRRGAAGSRMPWPRTPRTVSPGRHSQDGTPGTAFPGRRPAGRCPPQAAPGPQGPAPASPPVRPPFPSALLGLHLSNTYRHLGSSRVSTHRRSFGRERGASALGAPGAVGGSEPEEEGHGRMRNFRLRRSSTGCAFPERRQGEPEHQARALRVAHACLWAKGTGSVVCGSLVRS